MPWQELVKIALMGTERTQLSPTIKNILIAKGIPQGDDEARIILEGASYYAMMQKSGIQPKEWNGAIPEPAPEEKSENKCSPLAVKCLQQILNDTFPLALHEFILLLQQNKKHLPAELLPDLLDQCRQSPALWEKLSPCIGERGIWLLQLNTEWQFLLPKRDLELWKTGSRTERRSLLQYLRKSQAQEALALLESTWATEDLKSKLDFLNILNANLSERDEIFLEANLDDRRKEVRQLAANLLAKIPTSALTQRMYQRLVLLFSEKKKGKTVKLEMSLPEELTDDMIRDGIDPSNQWYQGGVKASRLGQMIANVPPQIWESHFEKSPTEVLQIFLKSNWDQLSFTALSMATALHQEEAWIECIFFFWLDHYQKPKWQNIDLQQLIPIIPATLFNKIALHGLTNDPTSIENSAPIGILLKELAHPWEDQLTILFFKTLKSWLQTNPGQYWSAWHFWNILEKAAYLINPALYPVLKKAFDNDPIWHQAEEEIDKFMRVLLFRVNMTKELNK